MKGKELARERKHKRIRKKISGTVERPRLCIHKSLNNICAQIIDDSKGYTLASISTRDKEFSEDASHHGNVETAKKAGKILGEKSLTKGIKKIVFDRGGYQYHGRIKAFADGLREAGLDF